jgi:uncharacterized protein (TIGR02145 family)
MNRIFALFAALTAIIFIQSATAQNTVKDFDGNTYKTVVLGSQTWMAENLKTTHYQNGNAIPNVIDPKQWGKLTSGAYCTYNNCSAEGNDTSGIFLYNWHTVVDSRKMCPVDYHVPTDAEWTTLINFLGGDKVAGGKMKESGTTHWKTPNNGATNESGLTVIPFGARSLKGSFKNIGTTAGFWSSTEYETLNAWHRNLNFTYPFIMRDINAKAVGLSVRCIKD